MEHKPIRLGRPEGDPQTSLARWLDAVGPVEDFDELLARYRSEVGPTSPEAFRVWLWRDAGVAVEPKSGHLCLPDEWPTAPTRPH